MIVMYGLRFVTGLIDWLAMIYVFAFRVRLRFFEKIDSLCHWMKVWFIIWLSVRLLIFAERFIDWLIYWLIIIMSMIQCCLHERVLLLIVWMVEHVIRWVVLWCIDRILILHINKRMRHCLIVWLIDWTVKWLTEGVIESFVEGDFFQRGASWRWIQMTDWLIAGSIICMLIRKRYASRSSVHALIDVWLIDCLFDCLIDQPWNVTGFTRWLTNTTMILRPFCGSQLVQWFDDGLIDGWLMVWWPKFVWLCVVW